MKKNFEYAKTKKTGKRFKLPRIEYQIYSIPILLLPIAPFFIACDKIHTKIKNWNYWRQRWSDKKATKVLDYFLPRVLDYDEDDDCYLYSTSWQYTSYAFKKYAPIGLKTWAFKYGYELENFIVDSYQKDGYTKTIERDTWGEEVWIKFSKKTGENQNG